MIKTNQILEAAQGDGAQTITLGNFDSAMLHQIQVAVSAAPTAGTLTVAIRTPASSTYSNLPWTIDLTDLATNSVFQFTGFATHIRFTPTGFDVGKTYTIDICTGNRSNY